jgi:hypothetical protein
MNDLPRAAIVHRTLRFLGPVTEQAAAEFVAALELAPGARVLDAATGDAGWAARVAARRDCQMDVAAAAGWVSGQHAWVGGFRPYDAVLDLGAPCPDATVYDHFVAAREVLRPGGLLLLGAGYWRLPPGAAYLARSGFRRGSMLPLGATFAQAHECGFRVRHWSASPPEAWEAYESHFRERVLDWADANAGHPGAARARDRAEERWRTYANEGRYVLGFALILAQAE